METQRTFGFLLKDLSRLYSRNFERHAERLQFTLNQCRVLAYLERHEGVSQVRLAYLTDTDPMTLGRLLERMEAEGLVERRPDPADRRARTLYLKAAATPVLGEIWRLSEVARKEAFSGLSAGERAQLVKLMIRIHGNLDALVPGTADRAGGSARASRRPSRIHADFIPG